MESAYYCFALSASGARPMFIGRTVSPFQIWVKASCCEPADAHHLRPDRSSCVMSPTNIMQSMATFIASASGGHCQTGWRLLDLLSG